MLKCVAAGDSPARRMNLNESSREQGSRCHKVKQLIFLTVTVRCHAGPRNTGRCPDRDKRGLSRPNRSSTKWTQLSGPWVPTAFMSRPTIFTTSITSTKLNVQQDWIHRSGAVFALREPSAPFSASYTYANQRHTLDDYFVRNLRRRICRPARQPDPAGEVFPRSGSRVAVSLEFRVQVVHVGSGRCGHRRRQRSRVWMTPS